MTLDDRRDSALSRRGLLTGAGALAAGAAFAGAPALAAAPSAPARAATWEDVYSNTFASYSAFESAWNYLYPWGRDHNGSARMYASSTDHSHVWLSGGVLTLRAARLSSPESPSTQPPNLPINYRSGAVHGKQKITVSSQFPQWEVKGEFQAPTGTGTWPAFWLTAVEGWPPESDILEFKGTTTNLFNTFRTPTDVSSTTKQVGNASSTWHTYRAYLSKVNNTDVDINYYLDGAWQATHRATGFVGKAMNLIINLQMEGSAPGRGPDGNTDYRARNVYVGRQRA